MEDNDRYKYLILKLLEIKQGSLLLISEIGETIGLSKFHVRQSLEELSMDLNKENVTLSIFKTGECFIEQISYLCVKKLRKIYIKRSNKYLYFYDVLLNGKTMNKFIEENFIGRTKAYEIRKKVNKIIKEQGLKLKGNKISGEETQIRAFYLSFFFSIFEGLEIPFDEKIQLEANHLLTELVLVLELSLSNLQRIKLRFFLCIFFIQKRQSFKVSIDMFEELFTHEKQGKLAKYFNQFEKKRAIWEWNYLLMFLHYELKILVIPNSENEKVEEVWRVTGKQLIEESIASIAKANQQQILLPDSLKELLSKECISIFVQRNWFPTEYESFYSFKQINYFQESYPVISRVILHEVNQLVKQKVIQEAKKIHFYYDFLFLLLSKIPLNELEKTIVICVDFSYGKAYTELITAQIEGFNNLTLKIEHKLTEKTDLYISDVAMSREKLEQIIWKNPPTPEDWKYFGEKIIEIKGREHFA